MSGFKPFSMGQRNVRRIIESTQLYLVFFSIPLVVCHTADLLCAGNCCRCWEYSCEANRCSPISTELTLCHGDLAAHHPTPWDALLCMSLLFCFLQSTFKVFKSVVQSSLCLTPFCPISPVSDCYRLNECLCPSRIRMSKPNSQ